MLLEKWFVPIIGKQRLTLVYKAVILHCKTRGLLFYALIEYFQTVGKISNHEYLKPNDSLLQWNWLLLWRWNTSASLIISFLCNRNKFFTLVEPSHFLLLWLYLKLNDYIPKIRLVRGRAWYYMLFTWGQLALSPAILKWVSISCRYW